MKKYFSLALSLLAVMAFTACTIDEGSTPGGDSKPVITIYSYEPAAPSNPDNDIKLVIAANDKVNDTYYLAEKTADKEARKLSADAYADYVVANGKKLEVLKDSITGGKYADLLLTDMYGEYTITAVGVNGGSKGYASVVFNGLDWTDVVRGTYLFSNPNTQFLLGNKTESSTTLQVCTTDSHLFRFKDVFSEGNSLKIRTLDKKGEDDGGVYTFVRVPDQRIGVQYKGVDAYVRDIGYWQGDDSWITDNGYESGMYEDYSCFIMVQLHVGSSNYGYNYYDQFIPEK